MKNLFLLPILLGVSVFFTACTKENMPATIFVDFTRIKLVKKQILSNDERYEPAYKLLLQHAETAINEDPFSVMDKKRTPPSGDKHDYLSMGPYWWPDSTKPDGLPYIRRDGVINPETRGEYVDVPSKNKMLNNLEILGWAFYFSNEKKYAEKAVELLETWFVNPETRMNPNLNFAQGIPGRMDGRGIGIIDWSSINRLISPLQILESNHILKEETDRKIHKWLEDYLEWLLTSKYGIDEDEYFNNHGTWYDVQVVAIQQFLDKTEDAKHRLETRTKERISTQIEPDGSQPFELERTKSLGYSTMNLRGFLHLAQFGKNLGVDLWNYKTEDGRSIKGALDFLMPYAKTEKEWTYQQLGHLEDAVENLKIDFLMAASFTEE